MTKRLILIACLAVSALTTATSCAEFARVAPGSVPTTTTPTTAYCNTYGCNGPLPDTDWDCVVGGYPVYLNDLAKSEASLQVQHTCIYDPQAERVWNGTAWVIPPPPPYGLAIRNMHAPQVTT